MPLDWAERSQVAQHSSSSLVVPYDYPLASSPPKKRVLLLFFFFKLHFTLVKKKDNPLLNGWAAPSIRSCYWPLPVVKQWRLVELTISRSRNPFPRREVLAHWLRTHLWPQLLLCLIERVFTFFFLSFLLHVVHTKTSLTNLSHFCRGRFISRLLCPFW